MVLYDTVQYTGRLLTVRAEYREHTATHAYRSPEPCQFELIPICIQPHLCPLFVAYPFIRLQVYPNFIGFHNSIASFSITFTNHLSVITPRIPDSANLFPSFPHPDIDPVRRTISNATVTSFLCNDGQCLPSLAGTLTFLSSSMRRYHNDASDMMMLMLLQNPQRNRPYPAISSINTATFQAPIESIRTLSRVRH